MSSITKFQRQVKKIQENLLIRFMGALIGIIATFLQYRDGDSVIIFWILFAITSTIVLYILIEPIWQKWYSRQERKWLASAGNELNSIQRISTLEILINEFEAVEKAKELLLNLDGKNSIRAVKIASIEGKVGVILNLGQEENLRTGTKLMIYKTDNFTDEGIHIEESFALVEVSYIQSGNNFSQAIIIDERNNGDYWQKIKTQLENGEQIIPPKNFVVPYILPELDDLLLEDLRNFRQSLELIRNTLIQKSANLNFSSEENKR